MEGIGTAGKIMCFCIFRILSGFRNSTNTCFVFIKGVRGILISQMNIKTYGCNFKFKVWRLRKLPQYFNISQVAKHLLSALICCQVILHSSHNTAGPHGTPVIALLILSGLNAESSEKIQDQPHLRSLECVKFQTFYEREFLEILLTSDFSLF